MKNLKKLYVHTLLNKVTIFIFILTFILLCIIFYVNSSIPLKRSMYIMNDKYYIDNYYEESINALVLINLILVIMITAIDYMTYKNRLELLFYNEFRKKQLIKAKLSVFMKIIIIYISVVYIIFLILPSIFYSNYYVTKYEIRLYLGLITSNIFSLYLSEIFIYAFNHGLASILLVAFYFVSSIIGEKMPELGSLIFLKIDLTSDEILNIGIFGGIIYTYLLYTLLVRIYCKKDLKLN